jgi:hypothetical protein
MKHTRRTRVRFSRRKYDGIQVHTNISSNLLTTYTQFRPKFHNHLVLPLKAVTLPPPPPKTKLVIFTLYIRMYIHNLYLFILFIYSSQTRRSINLKKSEEWIHFDRIVTCWGTGPLLNTKCDVFTVLETPFGLLLVLFTTSLVAATITYAMWRELGWLRLHFLVDSWSFAADLIWLFVSDRPWFLCSDVASLIFPRLLLTALK